MPSGGTLASVAVAGTRATLTITEGTGAADTTVGSLTVALAATATGIRDANGNRSSFAATAPADKAGPVPTLVITSNTNRAGIAEPGDAFAAVFSEAPAPLSLPLTTTVTIADPLGAATLDTINMPGVTSAALSTGSSGYILAARSAPARSSSTGSSAATPAATGFSETTRPTRTHGSRRRATSSAAGSCSSPGRATPCRPWPTRWRSV